jgi:hypothetical protein
LSADKLRLSLQRDCRGLKADSLWGGENRFISDDFGNKTDTIFVPCILLLSPFGAKGTTGK